MNEGKKTLAFWAVGGVMLAFGSWVAWPTEQADSNPIAGNQLFEKFTDPQAAASMKIVTFDEEQGQMDTFEVRRDRESGLWNIPSRDGYPADAIEQMRTAANALVGLKILDVQTSNAEDHDDLGVAEPKLEDLEVGDDGVGRLVTFKNEAQDTLASIIIGDQEKSDPEKRYVRIPGQDPVYVVKLDQSSLSTNFGDWIESDLLKLSSIDIAELEIRDYTAAISGRQLSLNRNYTAKIQLEGSEWKLDELNEFEPGNSMAEPVAVELADDEQLNKTKLDAMKNALDDLKIVNVVRKPDGMSANLKANKDFLDDNEARTSLMKNGFFPAASTAEGDVEIISANGELSVSLKDGVQYVMRFGNISGVAGDDEKADVAADEEGQKEEGGGVNRYMMVTTKVDQANFPPPEMREVPKTIEALKLLLNPPKVEPAKEDKAEEPEAKPDPPKADEKPEATDEPEKTEEEPSDKEPAEEEPAAEEPAEEEPASEEPAEEDSAAVGDRDAVRLTAAQDQEEAAGDAEESAEPAAEADDPEADDPDAEEEPVAEADKPKPESAEKAESVTKDEPEAEAEEELTEEEWQERLEAEQEKITKENQRKLDARKDKIEAAEKKVRELNDRFADWYYVIAEDTYAKLRIQRADLLEKEKPAGAASPPTGFSPGAAGPQFNIPGAPGN